MKTIFTIILLLCANLFGATVAEKLDDGIPVKDGSITATNGGLWIGNGTAFQLFPIGTNGQVLSVNTGATNKLEWVTGGGGGGTGTVTSIATNSGLTGGAITTTGTIGIATGGIVDSMVNASAAIAGTKIAAQFGTQKVTCAPVDFNIGFALRTPADNGDALYMYSSSNSGNIAIKNNAGVDKITFFGQAGTVTAPTFISTANAINGSQDATFLLKNTGKTDTASAVAFTFDTTIALTDDNAKMASFKTGGVEIAYIGLNLSHFQGAVTAANNVKAWDGQISLNGDSSNYWVTINDSSGTPSTPTSASLFYSSGGEMFAMDSSGNSQQLTPHATDAPPSMYDGLPGAEEVHKSINFFLGRIVWINVDRQARKADGEKLGACRMIETFAEYNARTGCALKVQKWGDIQAAAKAKRDKEITEQLNRKAKSEVFTEKLIEPFKPQAKPAFIK